MNRLLFLILIAACVVISDGMTRAQVKKTMSIMKNQCMPKNSVTEDQAGKIEQGVFNEDRNVMCYVACVYKSLQVWESVEIYHADQARVGGCIRRENICFQIIAKSCNWFKVKNDKLDMGLISKQIDALFPPDLKEPVKKSVALCIHSQDNYNDLCEGVFHAAKCLYEKDPASFIFP